MSFGERLKQIRENNGLQQNDVARQLGLKAGNAISNYEKNISKPHLDNFIKLCKLFNKDANYFLEEELSNIVCDALPHDAEILKNKYDNISSREKEIVDFILNKDVYQEKTITNPENVIVLPVCRQKASAGIGKIEDESNPDISLMCFDQSIVPSGATHGIIIEGHSMEDKFFDNQIVFIQNGLECAPSDYGIFSVTDNMNTKIYCKQLMQDENGSKYLHSFNKNIGDPDIDYRNVIDIHCIGKIV